jgi:GTP-binding protein YchF
MSLSIGIVGLPNVGKSTLFKAVTNKQVDIQNYPFTTIDPNVGVVAVPDERLEPLAKLSNSKKIINTTIEFIDIAGLVKGASQGEGLGNKFLANIREVDAIAQVVRAFEDKNITHVHNRIDPADDIAIINTELIMADLETITKRIEKTIKLTRFQTTEGRQAQAEMIILEKFKKQMDSGEIISKLQLHEEERALAKELNLLTAKEFLYVINVSEDQITNKWAPDDNLKKAFGKAPYIVMCNKLELSLSELAPEDKKEFLLEFGLPESGLDRLIKESYKTLGLITFLTTGEDETRAWTAHFGDLIPKASRAIHTDFEKLFIRADVINWKTLLEAGGWHEAKIKGLMHTVGKDYIIQEGDVVEIIIGR